MSKERIEIGSEFWSVPISERREKELFHPSAYWFISGRSALQAVIEDIKQETDFTSVLLPDYCCESMIVPFLKNGIRVEFYAAFEYPSGNKTDAILVMDYFGYTSGKRYKGYNGIVIRDVTHSLFSKDYEDADYSFGSLRKWAGFYTGGYAWGFRNEVSCKAERSDYVELREEAMRQKSSYIRGESDSKEYLSVFEKAENMLDDMGIVRGSERDVALAKQMDIDRIRADRRRNARLLMDAFSDIAVFPEMQSEDCPMFVPVRVKNRNELRKKLIENEIYCPIHWPVSRYHQMSAATRKLYDEELSLVCDQRYSEDDMRRMIKLINEFEGK